MKIHFWGAARTVTGSAHFLEVNGHKILLDCGLYQGKRKEAYHLNRSFRFPPKDIDAVVLSHAHIDHTGNLPTFVKNGYDGPVYATQVTQHLVDLMVRDSAHIQESDVAFANKWRKRKGKKLFEPLYTVEDADRACGMLVPKGFGQPFEVAPGVVATYVVAGHILGSASIILDIEEGREKTRLWFSGDIGRPNLPILRDPVFPEGQDVDYLLMECTYGDRPHDLPELAHERLGKVIAETLGRGGKVIIPSFAVGRTQELVYSIHKQIDEGIIPQVPVFVDSPLAVNVSDVFRKHRELFDSEAQDMMMNDVNNEVLGFETLTYVRSVQESKDLNERTDPMIIISASGMMEAGRVLHHLRHNIHDPNSTVLIVSWMAPHTLGRRLLEGAEEIKIYGEVFKRKIGVKRIGGFSAHAGQRLLKEYALGVKGQAKEVFLVHGEQRGADGLQEALEPAGMTGLFFPERGTTFEL